MVVNGEVDDSLHVLTCLIQIESVKVLLFLRYRCGQINHLAYVRLRLPIVISKYLCWILLMDINKAIIMTIIGMV